VVEASVQSGASITAKLAHGYDRSVFALPGRVHDVHSQGCLSLIADQVAQMALHPDQVLAHLNWSVRSPSEAGDPLKGHLAAVLNALQGPCRVDELQRATGLSTEHVLSALAELVWTGRAVARAGAYHKR
jgi:predicted Rossmann fold nucleotide-binding protein DprA/Smf involved in DNA uptake